MKYSGIGGQAVIEGIMMMNRNDYAVAVRKPDQEIEVKKDRYVSITQKVKLFSIPFVRGVFRFADSMIVGMKTLTYSASFFEDDEESEPGRIEKFLDRVLGEKLESALMAFVMVLSFVLAIGIFMLLPLFLAGLFSRFITSDNVMAILEGIIRIGIFIAYIKLVSRMEDIRRTFMYHGAEHKTIFCYEAGEELTVENIRKQKKYHPRCGTSFMILVLLVSIFISMLIPRTIFGVEILGFYRVLIKLLILPLIVGIGYELIKIAGRRDNVLTKIISFPGVLLQHISVIEPDDGMIECAIAAMKEVIPEDQEKDNW